jgi:hypothetical protein
MPPSLRQQFEIRFELAAQRFRLTAIARALKTIKLSKTQKKTFGKCVEDTFRKRMTKYMKRVKELRKKISYGDETGDGAGGGGYDLGGPPKDGYAGGEGKPPKDGYADGEGKPPKKKKKKKKKKKGDGYAKDSTAKAGGDKYKPPGDGDKPPGEGGKPPGDGDKPPGEGGKPPHGDGPPPGEGEKPPGDDPLGEPEYGEDGPLKRKKKPTLFRRMYDLDDKPKKPKKPKKPAGYDLAPPPNGPPSEAPRYSPGFIKMMSNPESRRKFFQIFEDFFKGLDVEVGRQDLVKFNIELHTLSGGVIGTKPGQLVQFEHLERIEEGAVEKTAEKYGKKPPSAKGPPPKTGAHPDDMF